jgi:very-short-patch-repair endonuclease
VDFLWQRSRLVAELDGSRAHAGRIAFERDRVRDFELRELGYDVIRLTWRQVTTLHVETARTVRKLLRARGQ